MQSGYIVWTHSCAIDFPLHNSALEGAGVNSNSKQLEQIHNGTVTNIRTR